MAQEINITAKLNLGDFNSSMAGMRKEMKALQKVLGDSMLSDADKVKVIGRMAAIRDEITDLSGEFKNIDASNTFQNINTALGPLTAGLSAVASTTALIGSENKELEAIMQKVSATMAIVAAAAQLNDAKRLSSLYKYLAAQTTALAQNIKEALTITTVTVATEAENVAKTKTTVITKTMIVLQKAWNAVVKANPIMLLVTAVAALVTGIVALSGAMNENSKYTKAMQAAQEEMVKSVGDELSQLNILKQRLDDQNISQDKRLQLVNELMKKYPKYLNDMDREKLLAGDTSVAFDKLASSIRKKALAEALAKQQADITSKIVEKQLEQIKLETYLREEGANILNRASRTYQTAQIEYANLKKELNGLNEEQRIFSRVIAMQTNEIEGTYIPSIQNLGDVLKNSMGLGGIEDYSRKASEEAVKMGRENAKKAVEEARKLRLAKLSELDKQLEDNKKANENILKDNKDAQDKLTEMNIKNEFERAQFRLKIDYENNIDAVNRELKNYTNAEKLRSDAFYKRAKKDKKSNEDLNLLKYLSDEEYGKLSEEQKIARIEKRAEYEKLYGADYLNKLDEISKEEYNILQNLNSQKVLLEKTYAKEKELIFLKGDEAMAKQIEATQANIDKGMETFADNEKKKQDLIDETNKKVAESLKTNFTTATEGILVDFYTTQFDKMFQDLNYNWDKYYKDLETRRDFDIANLEDQVKRGIMTEEEYQIQKTNIEKMAEAKRKEAEKKAFYQEQSLNKSRAIMDGAVAAAKSFANLGWPLGLPAALAAIAAVALQIDTINNQKPPYAKGGWINGSSHKGGGVDINAEGGEYVVNKGAMQNPTNAAVVETINSGGGIDFNALVTEVVSQISSIPVILSEGDVTKSQRRVEVIERNSKIM